jgi:hypothetical protein
VRDSEGFDAADLADARRRAIADIRKLLGHELETGTLDLRGKIDIADDKGTEVMTVRFSEAVSVIGS